MVLQSFGQTPTLLKPAKMRIFQQRWDYLKKDYQTKPTKKTNKNTTKNKSQARTE